MADFTEEEYWAGVDREAVARRIVSMGGDPRDLESAYARFRGDVIWEEPVRADLRERHITLVAPFQASLASLPAALLIVRPATYRVVANHIDGPFVVRVDGEDLQLLHSWRGLEAADSAAFAGDRRPVRQKWRPVATRVH